MIASIVLLIHCPLYLRMHTFLQAIRMLARRNFHIKHIVECFVKYWDY